MILRLVEQLSVRLKATITDIAVDHSLLVQLVTYLFHFCALLCAFDSALKEDRVPHKNPTPSLSVSAFIHTEKGFYGECREVSY